MLDDRSAPTSAAAWEADANVAVLRQHVGLCWEAYVGAGAGDPAAAVSAYASPARAASLAGLPSTYIDCGGLDAFRNDSLTFALRLCEADVEVETHTYSGVPHIFDFLAPKCQVTRNAIENRNRAISYL
jgi:acetyl esterase/lipase